MVDQLNTYNTEMLVFLLNEDKRRQMEAEWIYRLTKPSKELNRKKTALTNILEGTGQFLINSGNKLLDIA